MVRIVAIVLLALLAGAGLIAGTQHLAAESGEVVVVRIYDATGGTQDTRLWVVDDDGALWIRGRPASGWLARLAAHPEIDFTRAGVTRPARAVLVDGAETRRRINRLMREKYGLADRYIALVLADPDRDGSVPVRLDPR